MPPGQDIFSLVNDWTITRLHDKHVRPDIFKNSCPHKLLNMQLRLRFQTDSELVLVVEWPVVATVVKIDAHETNESRRKLPCRRNASRTPRTHRGCVPTGGRHGGRPSRMRRGRNRALPVAGGAAYAPTTQTLSHIGGEKSNHSQRGLIPLRIADRRRVGTRALPPRGRHGGLPRFALSPHRRESYVSWWRRREGRALSRPQSGLHRREGQRPRCPIRSMPMLSRLFHPAAATEGGPPTGRLPVLPGRCRQLGTRN